MNIIVNKNRVKSFLASHPIIAKLYFDKYSNLLYDETTIPYISIYKYNPRPYTTDNIIIPFYFTDFYQREYYYNDTSLKFKLRYELDGVVKYINNLTAGDFNLELGQLSEGTHWYSIQVIDEKGRESRRIFHDILVINESTYITESNTYTITDNDLANYNINKENSTTETDMINNRVGLTNLFANLQAQGYRKVILPNGIYRINRALRFGKVDDKTCPICIPTDLTVDMNESTFKLHPYDDREYGDKGTMATGSLMVRMKGCHDSHLINGTIEGDFFERRDDLIWEDGSNAISGSNGEFNFGFEAQGGEFCSLENVTIKQITGYNVGAIQGGNKGSGSLGEWTENTSIEKGVEIVKEGYVTSKLGTLNEDIINAKYIIASVWLMSGYLRGKYWDVDFHFYDINEKFIETIKVYQFTRCRIPNNAKYFRCTFKGASNEMEDLSIHCMDVVRYFECKNCHWIDNRTCANPAQSHFYTYENCDFTRCGYSITPCVIDLEDGWEHQQDIFIDRCNILERATSSTSDVIDCSGINHVYENNNNFRYDIRYRVRGLTIRNNNNPEINTWIGFMTGNTFRIYNNTNILKIILGVTESNFWGYDKTKVKLKDNTMLLSAVGDIDKLYSIDNSVINFTSFSSNINCKNSTIRYTQWNTYIGENIYFEKCIFEKYEDNTEIQCCFNKANAIRKFIECTYKDPTVFYNHYYFNSGLWESCIFESTLGIRPKTTNTMGDIQFNNCRFKDTVNISIELDSCFVQFNNCIFEKAPTFDYFGKTNSEFNDCILPNSN